MISSTKKSRAVSIFSLNSRLVSSDLFATKIFLHRRKKISNLINTEIKLKVKSKYLNMRAEDLSAKELLEIFKLFSTS